MEKCSIKSFSTGLVICTKSAVSQLFAMAYMFGLLLLGALTAVVSEPNSTLPAKIAQAPVELQLFLATWFTITVYGCYYYQFKTGTAPKSEKIKNLLLTIGTYGALAYIGWSAAQVIPPDVESVTAELTLVQFFTSSASVALNVALLPARIFAIVTFAGMALLLVLVPVLILGVGCWSLITTICKTGRERANGAST